jgi:2,3-bisphosphoglycerate-independent phosphoglycerate mutase
MINATKLAEELIEKTGGRILLVIMDGVGDVPDAETGKTPLEAAKTPNLDKLAPRSSLGLAYAIGRGITPGSGPAHMSLFGYDPVETRIGRGVLEALGVGMEMGPDDLAFRCNFASLDEAGNVTDRRAGRIPTEKNEELVAKLKGEIGEVEGCEIILHSGLEHRFVAMLRRAGLSDRISETDPQATGVPALPVQPLEDTPEAELAAKCANALVARVDDILKDETPANTCLLRGPAKFPDIRPVKERFGIRAAAIAAYPMYRGLAQLVGMDILDAGKTLDDEFARLESAWNDYDYFFLHVKKTDSYGEDGNYDQKVHVIEEFDALLPRALALGPDVLAITCDHSTPVPMKGHSWHPSPFLLKAAYAYDDGHARFTERNCQKGSLGHFPSLDATALMLANAGRLAKFGA